MVKDLELLYLEQAARHHGMSPKELCVTWGYQSVNVISQMLNEISGPGWLNLKEKYFYKIFADDLEQYSGTLCDILAFWNTEYSSDEEIREVFGEPRNLTSYTITDVQWDFAEANSTDEGLINLHKSVALGRLKELVDRFGEGGFFEYFITLTPHEEERVAFELLEISKGMDLDEYV